MRTCYCGGRVCEVARLNLRTSTSRRKVRRLACEQCGLESSTTLTEEEELERAQADRAKEIAARSRKDY